MADNDDNKEPMTKDDKVNQAVTFMQQVNEAETTNRQMGLTALEFSYGDQWPQYAINSRGLDRPQLTINEVNTYIRKVTNAQRKQRPRGKASPVDNFATKQIAKVITGLGRHVEVNSDADNAYDTAFDFAARIGWGYWRVRTDYVSEDSFDQDIYIDVVDNPFTVYFDNNSVLPDGSDATQGLITDLMLKTQFSKDYPDAQVSSIDQRGVGDNDPDWVTTQDIRLAEYYFVEKKKARLVMLTDGTTLWDDEVKPLYMAMQARGIQIKGDRDSYKRIVKWRKQTAFEILEEKVIPGRYIPIVPVYWTNVVINSRRMKCGLVKDAIDPQRMVNFWNTSITEVLALAPKQKWLIAEGADESNPNDWKNANLSPMPVLRYKTTGLDGNPIPPPQRINSEPPPAGFIEAAFMATQNLSRVLGVFDPAVRGGAQHKSDATLNAEQGQADDTNFNGYDNLLRSIKHTWRIMISYFPVVYDTQRVQRIIGEDGRDEIVTLNERTQAKDEQGNPIEKVLNDISAGKYGVIMDTGPAYNTKRQEAVGTMMELLGTPLGAKVAELGDDLIVRDMDFMGSDTLADRMAAANPMAQIDEQSDIPPKIQLQIKGMQMQLQKAGQVIQELQGELKNKMGIETMKQDAATKRTLLQTTAAAHDTETNRLSKEHDVEARTITSQNVAEINGLVQLLIHHLDTARLDKEIASRDVEQQVKNAEQSFEPMTHPDHPGFSMIPAQPQAPQLNA